MFAAEGDDPQLSLVPIGTVHSPYSDVEQIPRCPAERLDEESVVELFPRFRDGLKDLEGFSHVHLITLLHRAGEVKLRVVPFFDDQVRGVFATRSPFRPNHLGLSVVELIRVEDGRLFVKGIDLLDGTPLLDIKPYTPYDARAPIRVGWLAGRLEMTTD